MSNQMLTEMEYIKEGFMAVLECMELIAGSLDQVHVTVDVIKSNQDTLDTDLEDVEEMNDTLDSMYWRQQKISTELRDALYEILDQVSEFTGPMPMMVREIAKQALGEE